VKRGGGRERKREGERRIVRKSEGERE